MTTKIDPTQNKDQHCKVYLEIDVKNAIQEFQKKRNLFSFSEAARELILLGLNAEEQSKERQRQRWSGVGPMPERSS